MANNFILRIGVTESDAQSGASGSNITIALGIETNLTQSDKFIKLSSTYKVTSTTLVDSSRNAKGEVISNVIRAGIRKIELSWKVMSVEEYSVLADFFDTNFMFYAYYFDTNKNSWLTKHFYVGDRVADAVKNKQININTGVGGGVGIEYIENVKFSLIEV